MYSQVCQRTKPDQAVMALNLYSGNTWSEYRPGLYNRDMLIYFPQFLQHNAATELFNRPRQLPPTVEIIIHYSSYHSTPYNLLL